MCRPPRPRSHQRRKVTTNQSRRWQVAAAAAPRRAPSSPPAPAQCPRRPLPTGGGGGAAAAGACAASPFCLGAPPAPLPLLRLLRPLRPLQAQLLRPLRLPCRSLPAPPCRPPAPPPRFPAAAALPAREALGAAGRAWRLRLDGRQRRPGQTACQRAHRCCRAAQPAAAALARLTGAGRQRCGAAAGQRSPAPPQAQLGARRLPALLPVLPAGRGGAACCLPAGRLLCCCCCCSCCCCFRAAPADLAAQAGATPPAVGWLAQLPVAGEAAAAAAPADLALPLRVLPQAACQLLAQAQCPLLLVLAPPPCAGCQRLALPASAPPQPAVGAAASAAAPAAACAWRCQTLAAPSRLLQRRPLPLCWLAAEKAGQRESRFRCAAATRARSRPRAAAAVAAQAAWRFSLQLRHTWTQRPWGPRRVERRQRCCEAARAGRHRPLCGCHAPLADPPSRAGWTPLRALPRVPRPLHTDQ